MMRYASCILVMAALLAGCGNTLKSGTVTGKDYYPAHNAWGILPVMTGEICTGGKYSTCMPVFTYIPYVYYVPADYVLHLQACPTAYNGTKKKCRTGDAHVDSVEYDAINIGSYYRRVKGDARALPKVPLHPRHS